MEPARLVDPLVHRGTQRREALDLGVGESSLAVALGIGACASATTRHSVRWVVERHGARGPLADFAADAARASALVPPLALTILFAVAPGGAVPVPVPAAAKRAPPVAR